MTSQTQVARALADRYRLESRVGGGGMAEVYLAFDLRHGRKVALKVLRDDVAEAVGADRFLQEIRTTAGLQHPHILPLLDSGEIVGAAEDCGADRTLYYVMPYVAGETLRARLDRLGALGIPEAVSLTRAIASALDYAHRNGVIHRDIKPENILLSEDLPMVADFGIALALAETRDARLTQTGFSLGTPQYMSPEQVTGERTIDGRTDQYSVACLLYEMMAGRPPFRGATAQATMVEHVIAAPPPLTSAAGPVPEGLGRAFSRAMAKDPQERFARMSDFAAAIGSGSLATVPAGGPVSTASIVVLPFENLSADPENAFFADGLTDEIISDLSKVRALRVISRSSAAAFKGARRPVPSICAEVNVRYALEGSVRRAGTNLRITAQLVDSTTDSHVWSEKYAGTVDDVFELQERLSREIVQALRVTISPQEDRGLAARDVTDVRVFEVCALARQEIYRVDAEALGRAARLTEDAIAHFGRKLPLLATLANVEWNFVNWGVDTNPERLARAEALAQEALAADPDYPAALFVLAFIGASHGRLHEALGYAERAHKREPGNPDVLLALSMSCSGLGRIEESLRYGRRLAEVDPLTPVSHFPSGWASLCAGDARSAMASFETADRLDGSPNLFSSFLGIARYTLGDRDGAVAAFERAAEMKGFFGTVAALLARGVRGDGPLIALDDATLKWVATDWSYSWALGQAYAMNGEAELALPWLSRGVERGFINYPYIAHHDRLIDSLRQHPGFEALLARVRREWEVEQPGG